MVNAKSNESLAKELGWFDVFVISTGAMISSGFFLLPGLATAKSGPSAVLAYLIAGVLVLPAMFSKAELSTAMPKAGGTYYFLDRSLGPMVGTMAGFGTWAALVLKSTFALIGMGAYIHLFWHVPIQPLAVGLTVGFTAINIFGAKESTRLQGILVVGLLTVLAFFMVQGVQTILAESPGETIRRQFTPFLPMGVEGLAGTVGFVFVSYAGLTKVASVAEEVGDAKRSIPLGMGLSLATATFVYVVGVFIMITVLDSESLRSDLTPAATAGEAFFSWLPEPGGLILITLAAVAAFASTGNAGLMSASRYPLAMARDRLLWHRFAEIGRFGTPTLAVLFTGLAMIVVVLSLDVESVAKLASSFQLFLFSLVNLAVIVMRESRIPSYAPPYKSPLYPWMQIAGTVVPLWLIWEMGWVPMLFTLGVAVLSIIWYRAMGLQELPREGAIYHVFERLGRNRYAGLDAELRQIFEELEHPPRGSFEAIVDSALVIDDAPQITLAELLDMVASELAVTADVPEDILREEFHRSGMDGVLFSRGAAFINVLCKGVEANHLAIVRSHQGIEPEAEQLPLQVRSPPRLHAVFFLAGPRVTSGFHLRVLGQLAARTDQDDFLEKWLAAPGGEFLRKLLIRHEHSIVLHVTEEGRAAEMIGVAPGDLVLPESTFVALIQRGDRSLIPEHVRGIHRGDRLTILGEHAGIEALYDRYEAA